MVSFTRVLALVALFAFPIAAARDRASEAIVAKAVKDFFKFLPDLPGNITTIEDLRSELQKRMARLNPYAAVWKPVKDPQEEKINMNSLLRFRFSMFQCPCSPSNRTSNSKLPKAMDDLRKTAREIGGVGMLGNMRFVSRGRLLQLFRKANDVQKVFEAAKELTDKCSKDIKMEGCVNADTKSRRLKIPMCDWDNKIKKNVFNGVTVGSCDQSWELRLAASSINEGCVAVEHLNGFVLQHPTHLMRPVMGSARRRTMRSKSRVSTPR